MTDAADPSAHTTTLPCVRLLFVVILQLTIAAGNRPYDLAVYRPPRPRHVASQDGPQVSCFVHSES